MYSADGWNPSGTAHRNLPPGQRNSKHVWAAIKPSWQERCSQTCSALIAWMDDLHVNRFQVFGCSKSSCDCSVAIQPSCRVPLAPITMRRGLARAIAWRRRLCSCSRCSEDRPDRANSTPNLINFDRLSCCLRNWKLVISAKTQFQMLLTCSECLACVANSVHFRRRLTVFPG